MVKVSVIMPTYNDRSTVESAVRSILEQKFADWELIIVDDASADDTLKVLNQFHADPRIMILHSKANMGSGVARNRAIASASGEYLAVMDADDLSLPDRLATQVRTLDADQSLAAVSSQVAEFGDWGGPVKGRWPVEDSVIAHRQRTMKIPIPHPATMFRTEEVRRVGGYDETCRRAQDFALFLRLSDRPMRCLPEVLLHYRTMRPVPLDYVILNGRYAALARKRFELLKSGCDLNECPTEPRRDLLTDAGSLKSWVVRNLRERTGI